MARLSDRDRIAALERSGLLKKDLDGRIQHLAYTAYSLLKADAAQLNVHIDGIQRTVAEWPRAAPVDLPAPDSGCYQVLVAEQTLAVPDTLDHPTMCVLPWANTFRGYLGAVVCFDNQAVGTLCALSIEKRCWTPLEIVTIEAVARLVTLCLEEERSG